jgi:ribosomal protein S18 acetylase RimI-like enzyme
MATKILVRRPNPEEHDAVRNLVQTVVDETYGGIWGPAPLSIDDEDWSLAWIAVSGAKIVGVVLTHQEWIDDLWVLRESRGQGIGQRLLAQGEAEIISRGYNTFRLRVTKSNTRATRFYQRHGWHIAREFQHEKLPVIALEMIKSAPQRMRGSWVERSLQE